VGASSTSEASIRVAATVAETDAEGPGRRFALWVQGCGIRCDGCFNPQMWSTAGGRGVAVDELLDQIESSEVEGITLLGGEPFEQAHALSVLADAVRQTGLSVMTFTGYEYEQLTRARGPHGATKLIAATDLLVTGPYLASKPDLKRPWVGSTNQEFHFLTDRYRHLADHLEELPDRVEVRVAADGGVTVNGWAAVSQLDDLLAELGTPVRRGRVR